jgi:integrase
VRVNMKGVKKATKRLADGTEKIYYYAWVGGPLLEGLPGSIEFKQSYDNAVLIKRSVPKGTMAGLITEFENSAEFERLAPKTKHSYTRLIKEIRREFGDMTLGAIEDKEVRGEFKKWRDGKASTPREADYAWTVLARILSVAWDRGRISRNPCAKGGRLYKGSRSDKTWPEETIKYYLENCREHLKWPVLLALWTFQRQGDLLRLSKKAYIPATQKIRLRQSKTREQMEIRAGAPIKSFIEMRSNAKDPATTILVNSDGMPWTSDGFRASFFKELTRLEINGLTFHDLRGTSITRGLSLDLNKGELSAISGLSLKTIDDIMERHYFNKAGFAESGMVKLETGTYFGNRLETAPCKNL